MKWKIACARVIRIARRILCRSYRRYVLLSSRRTSMRSLLKISSVVCKLERCTTATLRGQVCLECNYTKTSSCAFWKTGLKMIWNQINQKLNNYKTFSDNQAFAIPPVTTSFWTTWRAMYINGCFKILKLSIKSTKIWIFRKLNHNKTTKIYYNTKKLSWDLSILTYHSKSFQKLWTSSNYN